MSLGQRARAQELTIWEQYLPAPAAAARRTGGGTARAISRAHRFARFTRALSVAMPVFAYIWRYSFEIRTNARRARSVGVQRERAQILRQAVEPIPHRLRPGADLVRRS